MIFFLSKNQPAKITSHIILCPISLRVLRTLSITLHSMKQTRIQTGKERPYAK